MKKIMEDILGFSFVIVIFMAIFAFFAMVGGGIMKLFGFSYESFWHLLLFFIIAAVVGFPIETLAGALPKVLHELNLLGGKLSIALYVMLDTMSTFFVLSLVDYFMESVRATELSLFVYALGSAILSIDKDKNDEDNE